MSDPHSAADNLDGLRAAAAAAVTDLPGVLRLEPNLATTLHRLRTTRIRGAELPATRAAADESASPVSTASSTSTST